MRTIEAKVFFTGTAMHQVSDILEWLDVNFKNDCQAADNLQ
jgi:hypothetical protein